MSRLFGPALAGAAVLFACALAPSAAHAEPYFVAAPEGWLVFTEPATGGPTEVQLGGVASAIGGLGLDFDPLLVGPQLALSGGVVLAHLLPETGGVDPLFDQTADPSALLRVTAGGSIGIAGPVEVSIFARGGIGYLASLEGDGSTAGLAIDAGASVDYRVDRDFTIGGQLGYAGLVATADPIRPLHAVTLGPRFGFWF